MNNFLQKIDSSFRATLKGEENINIVLYRFGIIGYLVSYFIFNKAILAINSRFFDLLFSWLGLIYFSWHIFALIKCSPKKPQLSKEEKKKMREEKWRNTPKIFMRKLFLQESITKWNPIGMAIAVDLLFCTLFLGYIIH